MAQDKKITQLTPLLGATANDLFPIVDSSVGETKSIAVANLFSAPQPIGNAIASTGEFTSLELSTGSVISEFSTDGTLSGDSDSAVPTEKATKTYIDTQISGVSTTSISQGNSSVSVIDTTAPGVVEIVIDSTLISTIDVNGIDLVTGLLTLPLGTGINEFSTDVTLFDNSNDAVPTEKAVKTYVDTQISIIEIQADKNDYFLPPQEIAQNSINTLRDSARIELLYDQQLPKVSTIIPKTGGTFVIPGGIEELENNNFAISTTNSDVFLSIITPDGSTVVNSVIVSEFDSNSYNNSELVRLQNGKIVVLYSNTSNAFKFRMYDPDGVAIDTTADHTISTSNIGQFRVTRLTNEKFFVVFSDNTSGQVKYMVFNEDGTTFVPETIFYTGTGQYIRCTTLTTGSVFITYQDTAAVGSEYLFFTVITPDGQVTVSPTQLSSTVCVPTNPNEVIDLTTLPNGNVFVCWADNTLQSKYKIINGYGTEVLSETSLASSGNVNRIACTYLPNGDVIAAAYDAVTPLTTYSTITNDGSLINQWTENTQHHGHMYAVTGKTGKVCFVWSDAPFDPDGHVELYNGLGIQINGEFELGIGARVNEISTDITLAGNSDTALITEHAAKTYTDNAVTHIIDLDNEIHQGDSRVTVNDNTSAINIEFVINGTEVALFTEDTQIVGTTTLSTYIKTTQSTNDFDIYTDSNHIWNTNSYGRSGIPAVGTYSYNYLYAGIRSVHEIRMFTTSDGAANISAVGQTNTPLHIRTGSGTYNPYYGIPAITIDWAPQYQAGATTVHGFLTAKNALQVDEFAVTSVPTTLLLNNGHAAVASGSSIDYKSGIVLAKTAAVRTVAGSDYYVEVYDSGTAGLVERLRIEGEDGLLTLTSGVGINEFSSDGTLAGDSDNAIPTEKAVKTYVDNISVSTNRIYEGLTSATAVDSTAGEQAIIFKVEDSTTGSEITDIFYFDEAITAKTVNDDFTGTNGDPPNTDKWTETVTNWQYTIQSNQLYTSLDKDIFHSTAIINANWQFAASTDIVLYIDLPIFTWNNGNYNIAMVRLIDSAGDEVSFGRDVYASADWYRCRTYISSVQVNRGNTAPSVNYPNGKLRLRRTGNNWDCYIYNETTLNWDNFATFTWAATRSFRVRIETKTGATGDDLTTAWDNFSVSTGTIQWDEPDWVNPGSAFDGNTLTFARTNGYPNKPDTFYLENHSNTCPGTDLGAISKVELRLKGYSADGTNVGALEITPTFDGTTSTTATITGLDATSSYSNNIDITNVSGAPDTWTWTDIQNVDVTVTGTINAPADDPNDNLYVSMVQIIVTYSGGSQSIGSVEKARIDVDGLTTVGVTLSAGETADEISNDTTLADDSATTLPTEHAVKSYVDSKIAGAGGINVRSVSSDSTAISGDAMLVDSTGGDVNIYVVPSSDGKVIVKKITEDSNTVFIIPQIGTIDGQSQLLINVPYESYQILSDGVNLFIM